MARGSPPRRRTRHSAGKRQRREDLMVTCVLRADAREARVHIPANVPEDVPAAALEAIVHGRAHMFQVSSESLGGAPCACGGACCGCCLLNPVLAAQLVARGAVPVLARSERSLCAETSPINERIATPSKPARSNAA
ncbi:hypothetical protein EMCLV022L [Equine molluscum contagiosum-like virus]|nr:hypothetical protein EMCLV022L [Equine molluscum contagiosum-like virus]